MDLKNYELAEQDYMAGMKYKEIAEKYGVTLNTVKSWKTRHKWSKDGKKGAHTKPEKSTHTKRGAQPGNKNSKGKKNAKGNKGGAPKGNKNAEKDGAYSTVLFGELADEDKEFLNQTPTEAVENLRYELKVLRWREWKILKAISEYEQEEDEERLYLTGTAMDMEMKDTPFARIQKLQEALYKVQGRAATVIGAIRQAEENDRRYELERERLALARMKATGEVEVEDVEPPPDETETGTQPREFAEP